MLASPAVIWRQKLDQRVVRRQGDACLTPMEPRTVLRGPARKGQPVAADAKAPTSLYRGRPATVLLADGPTDIEEARTIEVLPFARRIAAAMHVTTAVSLAFVQGSPPALDSNLESAHNQVMFSPDGRFLVTAIAGKPHFTAEARRQAGSEPSAHAA